MSHFRALVEPPVPEFGSVDTSSIRLGQLAPELGIQSQYHLQFIFFLTLPSSPFPGGTQYKAVSCCLCPADTPERHPV